MRSTSLTSRTAHADLVLVGTPVDLGRFLTINKPMLRVRYELQEIGRPTLEEVLHARFPVAPDGDGRPDDGPGRARGT